MNRMYEHVIVSRMEPQKKLQWDQPVQRRNNKRIRKQLPKVATIAAAVSLCIGTVVYAVQTEETRAVLSHLTAGFEYDETLGRLQYVANILPDTRLQVAEHEVADLNAIGQMGAQFMASFGAVLTTSLISLSELH